MFAKEASQLNWLADKGMYLLLNFAQRELQPMLRLSWLLAGITPAVCKSLLPPSFLRVYSVNIQAYFVHIIFQGTTFPC